MPRACHFKNDTPCTKCHSKMNYAPFLVFAFALFAQFASCSEGDYKVACKTDYSYVLKRFNYTARLFHDHLDEVLACLEPTVVDRKACFDAIDDMPRTYYWTLLLKDGDGFYFYSSPSPALLHQRECEMLNLHVRRIELVKDIELKEYNILTESDLIESLLDSIQIGINVKTDKSEVLRIVRDKTELIRAHFDDIKTCLRDVGVFDRNAFNNCISTVEIELSATLTPLPDCIEWIAGPDAFDDTDLIITLNKCLSTLTNLENTNGTFKSDLIMKY